MKVLPISNNNINLQKKQKSPNFQARINPEVLAQLKGRTKPVKDMIVKSVQVLYLFLLQLLLHIF